jgi:uncharacterized protein (TIGR02118 family)
MHRLLVLYPPPTDPDHFRSYYEDTHLKLVAQIPGLLGYRYGFDVAAGEGDSPYFCVSRVTSTMPRRWVRRSSPPLARRHLPTSRTTPPGAQFR